MRQWIGNWNEAIAIENGWDNLKDAAMHIVGQETFNGYWIIDGEPTDEEETEELATIATEELTIIEYVGGRTYEDKVTARILKKEVTEDYGNEVILIETDRALFQADF